MKHYKVVRVGELGRRQSIVCPIEQLRLYYSIEKWTRTPDILVKNGYGVTVFNDRLTARWAIAFFGWNAVHHVEVWQVDTRDKIPALPPMTYSRALDILGSVVRSSYRAGTWPEGTEMFAAVRLHKCVELYEAGEKVEDTQDGGAAA